MLFGRSPVRLHFDLGKPQLLTALFRRTLISFVTTKKEGTNQDKERILPGITTIMAQPNFELAVPETKYCILSYPAPSVLLVQLNRPRDLNCVNMEGHMELDTIWSWMDAEPNLACGIITGSGRAFSAGADLKGSRAI